MEPLHTESIECPPFVIWKNDKNLRFFLSRNLGGAISANTLKIPFKNLIIFKFFKFLYLPKAYIILSSLFFDLKKI